MKKLALILVLPLAFFACEKWNKDGKWDKDEKKECAECTDTSWEDPEVLADNVTVYELEPLQYDADGCITEGYIKYLENGKTAALVKYYQKEGVTYGHKTLCVDGDCKDKAAVKCTFTAECDR
jgi:hypothetical protein